jgi:GNAT superfamily N-acetyltransferase
MADYDIVQIEPARYRAGIVEMWRRYLPGTPDARFEWLAQGNPAGPAAWFAAIARETGRLAGMLSLMPKTFYVGEREIRAAVLGDFVVAEEARAFGPARQLPKVVLDWAMARRFDVVYTMPNEKAEKVVERAGFTARKTLKLFLRPISSAMFVKAGPFTGPVTLAARVVDAFFNAAAGRLAPADGVVCEQETFDSSFDALWEAVRQSSLAPVSDHSSAYLRWRYLQNPEMAFRVVTLRSGTALTAYAVFTILSSRLEVFELVTTNPRQVGRLLRGIADIGRAEGCKAVYLRVDSTDPIIGQLRRLLFLDARDDKPWLSSPSDERLLSSLRFSSGDRNI